MLEALREKPASGGKIIERLQAQGSDLVLGRAVVVYGALGNLLRRGQAKVIGEGPGERVYGLPDAPPAPPSTPGHPPSFGLGAAELALVQREVSEIARGLPSHLFEELRRIVIADADRRAFNGEKLPRAVASALADLGSPAAARAFLKRVEKGRPVSLNLRRRLRLGWIATAAAIVALGVLARIFVVGVYTLPPESISMAPTLVPGVEGGDAIVLADLLAYRFSGGPRRGDVVVFRHLDRMLVKRVMGLPGEEIAFKKGDLAVDGKVFVKERALLDRVKVPLLGFEDYRRTSTGWEAERDLTQGFRLPDGSFDGPRTLAREAVVVARVSARTSPSTISFVLDDGVGRYTVFLETGIDANVYGADGVEVEGASKELLRLHMGVEREVWITNADGVFRVEVDGREAVPRTTIRKPGAKAQVSVVVSGEVELITIDVARDLVHDDGTPLKLGRGEYCVLGDNATHSHDSRAFGKVTEDEILGRLFAVAWPWSRARLVR